MNKMLRKRKKWIFAILLLLAMYGTSNSGYGNGSNGMKKELDRKTDGENVIEKVIGRVKKCGNEVFYFVGSKEQNKEKSKEEIEKLAELENEKLREKEEEPFIIRKNGNMDLTYIEPGKQSQGIVIENKKGCVDERVRVLKEKKDTRYLLKNFYIVDSTTSVDESLFDVKKMLQKDFSFEKKKEVQILIYHTHGGSEGFKGEEGEDTSIIEVGEVLKKELEKYGYQVVHDKTKYDYVDGKLDRNKAYNQACQGVMQKLKKYPSIQVVIDLHRDGSATTEKKVTQIGEKQVAQFMIFNGLSRNRKGPITYLANAYLQDNLAFGLQLKIAAMEKYPDLTIKNYLKGYRYNLHLCKRSLLIELGNQNNTMEEAKNTMPYLAELLCKVIGS